VKRRPIITNAALLIGSVLVALVVAEIALHALAPKKYFTWQPNLRVTFTPSPEIMPGVSGPSHFQINADGLRGEPIPAGSAYRVLTVGGSTTECLYLDEAKTWPRQLQDRLSARGATNRAWVGNLGKSGLTSRNHVLQLERQLPDCPKLAAVVMLVGCNDLLLRLAQDDGYRPFNFGTPEPEAYEALLYQSFNVLPRQALPSGRFYQQTELQRLVGGLKRRFGKPPQDLSGKIYVTWREYRQHAPRVRETLPDLKPALDEYASNLGRLIELCRKHGARPLLVTQPALWRAGLSKTEEALLWMGGVGDFMNQAGCEYYSVTALASAMEQYNEALRRVCREQSADCIDLAAALPKDTTVFYDDVHFNERGAQRVAEVIADYLARHPAPHVSQTMSRP